MQHDLNTFSGRAAALGHSLDLLDAGHPITTTISVPTIAALRNTVLPHLAADEAAHQRVGKLLLGDAPADAKDYSDAGLMSRVLAHVYGGAPLLPADEERVAAALPATVSFTSAKDMTVNSVYPLATSQSGVTIVNVGTLTFQTGGALVCSNSILQFTADTVVNDGVPPQGYANFNILGVTGTTSAAGGTGGAGGVGTNGSSGTCASPGVQGDSGGTGGTGPIGGQGGVGPTGVDGSPSLPATIIINGSISGAAGPITIRSQSGAGGAGGTGGQGGDGATCGCEGTNGGQGGTGGVGGTGGTGGTGGNGVAGIGSIFVAVPFEYLNMIAPPVQLTAPAGAGGAGGQGGAAGSGGGGGSGGKHHGGGKSGGPGTQGAQGNGGQGGANVGQPAPIRITSSPEKSPQ